MYKTLLIDGLHCNHCVGIINIELYKIKEVLDVKVDIGTKRVIVRMTEPIPHNVFRRAIETAGYDLINII
jgi:copper chaperone